MPFRMMAKRKSIERLEGGGGEPADLWAGARRELRVAFSTEAQPLWFRVAKWVAFVAITRRLRGTRWLAVWIVGGASAGLALHAVYRWKTRGWTRPWGGWSDLEAPRR